ncbi:MAG TPA: ATP-binding protein [Saprospiraceae bacterium]|nr:ATP-binding protein [Saprospiraceae bacterium]
MQSLKRIGLYGVSGTGKTTILKRLMQLTSSVIWLEGASLVLDAAKLTLDEFKRLPEIEKYHFREMAILNALEIQRSQKQHIIIDGHLAFAKGENEFENVMTEKDKEFYTDFIYLKLSAGTVLERQRSDFVKKRDFSLDTIIKWTEFELSELNIVCRIRNINLHIIESENNQYCVDFIINKLINSP